jgi:DNA invertase Pin-like site-specific DNA recombinase
MLPENAILLVRISDDKAKDAHGVANQESNGRRYAAGLNWGIGRVIVENDTSAFKRKKIRLPDGRHELRTVRPGFRQALDLLISGVHDGLLAIDLDRAARDPRDLEDLIDVVESRTPRIPVESVSGSLRLANDSDITMARVMVAIANKASRDTSRRLKDHQVGLAEKGMPSGGGHRAYGYERDGTTVIDHEATVIDWMADRILDEDDPWSLSRIARDLTERGIPTATGLREWSAKSVSSILAGPRVAGLRRYQKKIAGEAAWPAILEREKWERVCAALSSRAHGKRSNQLRRWLTGVLVCGRCGHHLTGAHDNQPGKHRYWCMPSKGGCGKIVISAEHSEAEVEAQILEFCATRSNLSRLAASQEHVDVAKIRRELAEDEAQLKELAAEWAHKRMTLGAYREARDIIGTRIERAQSLLLVTAPRAVRRILQSGDVVATWREFTPGDKRDLVLAFVRGYRVLPYAASGPRRFDPDRLQAIPNVRSATAAQDSDIE